MSSASTPDDNTLRNISLDALPLEHMNFYYIYLVFSLRSRLDTIHCKHFLCIDIESLLTANAQLRLRDWLALFKSDFVILD